MNNCMVCGRGRMRIMKENIHKKYFEAFNFYFAKPINELIAQVPNTSHVIYFKDYVILDDDQEYLKRFYNKDEVKPRVDILTEFYVTNYKMIHPNLLATDLHKQMLKRNNKIDKIFYQKLQQSDQIEKQEIIMDNQVLNSKLTINSGVSYETDEHNIYESMERVKQTGKMDMKGLKIISNLKQLNASELLEDNEIIEEQFDQWILSINSMTKQPHKLPNFFYKSNPDLLKDLPTFRGSKRRTNQVDIRERKALLLNTKSESKNHSSFRGSKLKDSIEHAPEDFQETNLDSKSKLTRVHSDTSTIQKMLKDYQTLQKNRQLRQTISSDLLPASTSSLIQGFQGSQKSMRQDQNNGSIHSSNSQKQEQLKRVYQQHQQQHQQFSQHNNMKKLTTSQLDKIAKGGCLTERNNKRPLPIAEDIMTKLQDIQSSQQFKSVNNHDNKLKQEFKYMIPSQYNALQGTKQGTKAKSTNSKKITSDLGVKSQQLSNNHSQLKGQSLMQKTDEIVKKYIQFASQNINKTNNQKKFDFKLNLQGLNNDHNMQEQSQEDTSSNRNNFLTERQGQQQQQQNNERDFNSHRKIVLK